MTEPRVSASLIVRPDWDDPSLRPEDHSTAPTKITTNVVKIYGQSRDFSVIIATLQSMATGIEGLDCSKSSPSQTLYGFSNQSVPRACFPDGIRVSNLPGVQID